MTFDRDDHEQAGRRCKPKEERENFDLAGENPGLGRHAPVLFK